MAICQSYEATSLGRRDPMAWTKPVIREIECGMEINMYGPDYEEERETLI